MTNSQPPITLSKLYIENFDDDPKQPAIYFTFEKAGRKEETVEWLSNRTVLGEWNESHLIVSHDWRSTSEMTDLELEQANKAGELTELDIEAIRTGLQKYVSTRKSRRPKELVV